MFAKVSAQTVFSEERFFVFLLAFWRQLIATWCLYYKTFSCKLRIFNLQEILEAWSRPLGELRDQTMRPKSCINIHYKVKIGTKAHRELYFNEERNYMQLFTAFPCNYISPLVNRTDAHTTKIGRLLKSSWTLTLLSGPIRFLAFYCNQSGPW